MLVYVDPITADIEAIAEEVLAIARTVEADTSTPRRWRIPVVYGGDFGIDLAQLARFHGMTANEVVERHVAPVYRVFMLGFMPGFAYLGGLDQRLALPRRATPRAKVPSGSIKIGGVLAAVTSVEGPSGWHVIGRTPVRAFMPGRTPPFLLGPGDELVFQPIPAERWKELDAQAGAGHLVAESIE